MKITVNIVTTNNLMDTTKGVIQVPITSKLVYPGLGLHGCDPRIRKEEYAQAGEVPQIIIIYINLMVHNCVFMADYVMLTMFS